ncbi:unnamed protein product [Paramecium primaurelia]|uniref:Major facilitator superfamily domain-containing protein 12-like n=1 Tax=Paramecium primaurelia TaxID=5886 RepID=A0A8S1PVK7_PARPR|nr:unnamed protein product [Paramecium primaurelia]
MSSDRLIQSDNSQTNSLMEWNKASQVNEKEIGYKKYKFDSLTTSQFWAYCMGHMLNDLSAACWFNYLLFYLKRIIQVDFGSYAMLSGQVADALATPLVGYYSDRTKTSIGKRIPWYIGGYFVIIFSFLPVWNGNLILDWMNVKDNTVVQAIYYTVFPAIFNFGWASLQISHMSLVPSLTCSRSRRDKLNSIRNTFQFIAVLIVYVTALIFFQLANSTDGTDSAQAFQYLSLICVTIGTATSVYFIIQINEPKLTSDCTKYARILLRILKDRQNGLSNPTKVAQDQKIAKNQVQDEQKNTLSSDDLQKSTSESQIDGSGNVKLTDVEFTDDEGEGLHKQKANRGSMSEDVHDWKEWFKQMAFYRFGMVYMFFRLYCNVSSTMISFYIASVLKFTDPDSEEVKVPIQVALIPLSLYIMSVLTSASLSKFYQVLGKKVTLTVGTILCLLSSSTLIFLNEKNSYFMYAVSPFIGIAQAITLNTGITLISDVIGLKGSSGAFVFGAYSFLDKISSGIALFFCSYGSVLDDENLVRWLTVLVPSISCFAGCLLVVTAPTKKSEENVETQKNDERRTKSLVDELAT